MRCIPPGFPSSAVPRAVDEVIPRSSSGPMSRATSSTITPAVPVVPTKIIRPTTPVQHGKNQPSSQNISTPITTLKSRPATPSTLDKAGDTSPSSVPRQASKDAKPNEPVGKQQALNRQEKAPQTMSQEKEIYGKRTAENQGAKKSPTKANVPPIKSGVKVGFIKDSQDTKGTPYAPVKRQAPGRLDIAAATKEADPFESAVDLPKSSTQTKYPEPATSNSTSIAQSPITGATGSPVRRSVGPRTLRVVPTPKAEMPPSLPATGVPAVPPVSTAGKLRSRQASIASVNPPATPSDLISDTASITSASISRASSPPPIGGKVGSAPMRKKTKSQAKKSRQERKRQIEEEQALAEHEKSDVEIVQAPIIARKKKTKKANSTSQSAAVPAKGQPASPKPATVEDDHSDVLNITSIAKATIINSDPEVPEPEVSPEQGKEKRDHTAQAIIADLQKTGQLLASTLEFFKPLSSSLTYASRLSQAGNTMSPPDLKIHFSPADLDALVKKQPVRLSSQGAKNDSRTLITPNGKFFWGLTEELEEKALELEKQIAVLKGATRYHPRKHSLHTHAQPQSQSIDALPAISTALKEAGKKLGNSGSQQMPKLDASAVPHLSTQGSEALLAQPPPPPPQPQTPSDAGMYLNQFVLPKTDNPPPNQPRPEMAAVGGPPGAGTANMSVPAGKFAKAAKAVVEGGAVGSTEIDGVGLVAADLLGGVFVQGLEALVGAGLDLQHSFGTDTLNGKGGGLDVQGLVSAIESSSGLGSSGGRRGIGSVMGLEEAERAMLAARKEHDVLEKKLAALMKKNKRALGTKV